MLKTSRCLLLLVILTGCSSTIIEYPSVCPNNEPKCQRNLNARTLSLLGNPEAATKLLCQDPDFKAVLGDDCTS